MIHDLVLSLLTPNVDTLPIAAFLNSTESTLYLHPYEHKVLENIVQIALQHQQIRNFIVQYSTRSHSLPQTAAADASASFAEDEPLPRGHYLEAFCEGIDLVLLPFRAAVADLERRYLQTPTHSLMIVYECIRAFQPLLVFLIGFIGGVRVQRLHGCALLQYLHQHSLHGNQTIVKAVQTIHLAVHRVFLKQLTQWVLYGRFVDTNHEFFIQMIEQPSSSHHRDDGSASGGGKFHNTSQHSGDGAIASSATRGSHPVVGGGATGKTNAHRNADLWRYEINYDQLPPYFTPQWAEKVRFIGQTVVTFSLDPSSGSGADLAAGGDADAEVCSPTAMPNSAADSNSGIVAGGANELLAGADEQHQQTLWNDQEHVYVRKLRAICEADGVHLVLYETVIDEIKVYVSERLSEIAIQQADLVRQLRLIKDFYLLGRGEFYFEFIKQARTVLERNGAVGGTAAGSIISEAIAKDITMAFTQAAHSINVVDDLEQFQLIVSLDVASYSGSLDASLTDLGAEELAAAAAVVGFIPSISLRYRVRWPLHLLFSPRIIDGYNEMFRFLLQIKRIQYQLQMVWCDHRERRVGRAERVVQLRNKLMFVVNNLQYYLQVDVLEAQFSQLMQTVQESRDFEHIQRAHTVFQANVLSLCFLLSGTAGGGGEATATGAAAAGGSVTMAAAMLNRTDVFGTADNPVLVILNKIMQRVLIFCEMSLACKQPPTEEEQRGLRNCDEIFDGHVAELMRLLNGMRAGPSSAPLAQLLLRLDYNYWFSANEVQRLAAMAGNKGDDDVEEEDDI